MDVIGWIGKNGVAQVNFDVTSIGILGLESFMFAMIYGLAFRSWLVDGMIFLFSCFNVCAQKMKYGRI